jgi:TolB-like protein/DNA-binding winged helix-turn-helix (wHTH) protein/Flp pilus assembly protein TadD
MGALTHGFELEGLQVSPLTGEVSGPGGIAQLDPKVMAVLVLMAEHPGEVMLREDLVSRLWVNVVVSDDALTRCFYELRRHLSLAGGDERYRTLIETLPKRGYRLHAAVRANVTSAMPTAAPDPPRRQRWVPIAALAMVLASVAIAALFLWKSLDRTQSAAGAATTHSIAVLPFLDMSEAKDQRYLSDGVTEEILNQLTQAKNLRVISRTSTFALREEGLDVPEIGKRLDVDYVLEGSVRRAGRKLRITAQLIDVATNSHIWSKTYDRTLDDVFAVQDEIAVSVSRALQVEVAGDAGPGAPPASVEAYDLYLQGQFLYHRRSNGDIERAIEYYRKAVGISPEFARAWAALAGAYALVNGELHGTTNAELRELQGQAALKAVELEPDLAEARVRLGQYYYHIQQRDKGNEQMRLATSLDPDDPLVIGSAAADAVWNGDIHAAAELWRKAVTLDPLSPTTRGNFAYFLYLDGHLEESLAEFRRVLELNPASHQVEGDIARDLILLGRHEEAMAAIARMPEGSWRDFALALMHRAPEGRIESDAALARLAAAADNINDRVHLAEAYVYRGRENDALGTLLEFRQQLDRDRAQRSRDWWYYQDELRMAGMLEPLHDDPRWATLTAIPADR